MALIEARKLSVPGRLQPLDLALEAGEVLAVLGPNGSGKSTLLSALAGVIPATGQVRLAGRDAAAWAADERARFLALQPQSVQAAWSLQVRSVVALGRLPWGDEDAEVIDQAMRRAGIEALAERPVDRLSGGEQARVWLARVLAGEPKLWLADEPIASLDLKYQRRVLDCLRGFADAGGAVMLAIHDLSLAARYCDRFCLLDSRGRAVIGPAEAVLTEERLSEVFEVAVRVDLAAQPPVIQAV